ncbi:hypothetical protein SESBI_16112 [Sesbania bispinosa]|nr:hypothetical protein SESBI_16112 [Sesbania bispinosa]
MARKVVSYKDAIWGLNGGDSESSNSEEISSEDSSDSEEEGDPKEREPSSILRDDPFCPIVTISSKEHKMLIIDLENEYFLVHFSVESDYEAVFQNGSWMLAGHYLIIQKWQPNFFPFEDELKRVAVWIRIPGLPFEYYDHTILWRIANPQHVDTSNQGDAPKVVGRIDTDTGYLRTLDVSAAHSKAKTAGTKKSVPTNGIPHASENVPPHSNVHESGSIFDALDIKEPMVEHVSGTAPPMQNLVHPNPFPTKPCPTEPC